MKRPAVALFGSLLLMLMNVGFVAAQDGSFTGEIMDSACAKMGSHEGMMAQHANIKDAKTCTLGCVKGGAKFVLYDSRSKTLYQLDDQQKPIQFAGTRVKISGSLDKDTNTIHVTDIQGAPYKPTSFRGSAYMTRPGTS